MDSSFLGVAIINDCKLSAWKLTDRFSLIALEARVCSHGIRSVDSFCKLQERICPGRSLSFSWPLVFLAVIGPMDGPVQFLLPLTWSPPPCLRQFPLPLLSIVSGFRPTLICKGCHLRIPSHACQNLLESQELRSKWVWFWGSSSPLRSYLQWEGELLPLGQQQ